MSRTLGLAVNVHIFFVALSAVLLLSSCTSVKTISEFKLAEDSAKAEKNLVKSLEYLEEESASADFRAQLYDSSVALAVKFKIKTLNQSMYYKLCDALEAETKSVKVSKKVPPEDIIYLRRLAAAKLGELGDPELVRRLVGAVESDVPEVSSTALTSLAAYAGELRKDVASVMALLRAIDKVIASAQEGSIVKPILRQQKVWFSETLLDIDIVNQLINIKDTGANSSTLSSLLDWNYTLLENYGKLPKKPDDASIKTNLKTLAELGFPTGASSSDEIPTKARGILAKIAPLYSLDVTVTKALTDASGKSPVFRYAGEVFSHFGKPPFPTSSTGQSLPTPIPLTPSDVEEKVVELVKKCAMPEAPKPIRDGAWATLALLSRKDFVALLLDYWPKYLAEEGLSMEMLANLREGLASGPEALDVKTAKELNLAVAAFTKTGCISVLDAATFQLIDKSPGDLLTELSAAIDNAKAEQGEYLTRLALIYMTAVDNFRKSPGQEKYALDRKRLGLLLEKSNMETRRKVLQYAVERDSETAAALMLSMLKSSAFKPGGEERALWADALAGLAATAQTKLSKETVSEAIDTLREYVITEENEGSALNVARSFASSGLPAAFSAVREIAAAGSARSETLRVLVEAAVRRGK